MAFSWKKCKESSIRHLKNRIIAEKHAGELEHAKRDEKRLDRMQKDG